MNHPTVPKIASQEHFGGSGGRSAVAPQEQTNHPADGQYAATKNREEHLDCSVKEQRGIFIAGLLWIVLGLAAAAFFLWKSREHIDWTDLPVMLLLLSVFLLRHWEASTLRR